ncbi:GNAT family N-acetyltransferase [Aestuariimicrobium kwangyangense]|uniref:GNAT family N-acetyltransferase n=1 Tax=Aestuariimicrobium kwangyangense TaxID=396389 RepID=UPI0003B41FD0|nr:GNAT family protein [Aestuariimicrobium kwangyangense]
MTPLAQMFPPAGVEVRCGDLRLGWLSDDDLPGLVEVALRGVHDEDYMPFESPWTLAPRDELPTNTLRFLWSRRAAITPEDWNLTFGVFVGGRIAGIQELAGKHFVATRTASTGSWLGREFQGRGVGTLMRQLVCALAFDHLGAVECRSGAFSDNARSLGVSRKVGYEIVDTTREARADEQGWQTHHTLRLDPQGFVRPDQPIEYAGVEAFRAFIGLTTPGPAFGPLATPTPPR